MSSLQVAEQETDTLPGVSEGARQTFEHLPEDGWISATTLKGRTNLDPFEQSDALDELLGAGLIVEGEKEYKNKFRRKLV